LATAADFDADRAAGHRTLAVAYGRRSAAGFSFAAFGLALALGDYQGVAVKVFLSIGAIASLATTILPSDRSISTACVIIFVGFLLAAICHLAGW
jgi:4-hydroxybenzoate polyprenyltransferase